MLRPPILRNCGASRWLSSLGHEVKLIVPQVAKPYGKHPPKAAASISQSASPVRTAVARSYPSTAMSDCVVHAQVAARQRDIRFRDKLGRYTAGHANDADRRRKAMTALTAKMARVAHAVIKTGTEYRPFLERSDARWKDPSLM
jgi:hypothetical protein